VTARGAARRREPVDALPQADDGTADAVDGEPDPRDAQSKAAEQRQPHQHVAQWPLSHPLGAIKPLQSAEQPPPLAVGRVRGAHECAGVGVQVEAGLLVVVEDDAMVAA
jgi:hypothetical protein